MRITLLVIALLLVLPTAFAGPTISVGPDGELYIDGTQEGAHVATVGSSVGPVNATLYSMPCNGGPYIVCVFPLLYLPHSQEGLDARLVCTETGDCFLFVVAYQGWEGPWSQDYDYDVILIACRPHSSETYSFCAAGSSDPYAVYFLAYDESAPWVCLYPASSPSQGELTCIVGELDPATSSAGVCRGTRLLYDGPIMDTCTRIHAANEGGRHCAYLTEGDVQAPARRDLACIAL